MKKTEKLILLGIIGYYLYKQYTFPGSATQSSSAFTRAGGNDNWTVTVNPIVSATSAVQPS